MTMQEIEKLSILFTVLDGLPFFEDLKNRQIPATTITDIREKTSMHFKTVQKYLEFIQSSQELSYQIKIVKKKNSVFVLKFPNSDSNKILNIRIDTLSQQISEISRKSDEISDKINNLLSKPKR